MKLVSKEIFPIEARDKLVENLGKIDNGVCDLRAAVEWAEAKCLELNEEKEGLAQAYLDADYATTKVQYELNIENEELEWQIDGLRNDIEYLESQLAKCKETNDK